MHAQTHRPHKPYGEHLLVPGTHTSRTAHSVHAKGTNTGTATAQRWVGEPGCAHAVDYTVSSDACLW